MKMIVTALLLVLTCTAFAFADAPVLSIAMGWGTIPDQFADALTRYTEQTGVRFTLATPAGGNDKYHENLLVQFVAGSAPDLVFVSGERLAQFQAANVLLPLDAYYDRDVDFSEFLDIFDASRVNGTLYGFPVVGGGYRVNAIWVNRDQLLAAGLDIPGPQPEDALDYRGLIEYARRLTIDRDNDGIPEQWGFTFGTGWNGWTAWLPGNGARVFNEDKTEVLLDRPEAIEVFELLKDLNVTYGVRGGNFPQGTAAMTVGIRANQVDWAPAIGESFDWSATPMPKGRAGSVGVLNMNSIAINAASAHPEEAWKFIRFLMSEEEQTRRSADGLAVAHRAAAIRYQFLDVAPYDLSPFLFGPTVNRESMTMPGGAVWPAEANRFIQQVIDGQLDPTIGIMQAADVLRREIQR